MPIVRIESSIPLPPAKKRGDALAAIAACVVQRLDVKRAASARVDGGYRSDVGQRRR